MGRKGVSKRKPAKEKVVRVHGDTSAAGGHKADAQPDLVAEKAKAPAKDAKKR
jgi:hypothetical protein